MPAETRCLFGLDWAAVYDRNIDELREEWQVTSAEKFPKLSLAA
ncbi:MAG: hypothetical protein O3A63_13950 [Proteobacteria bacterium]|nr:hypothetical protein [Pseudomonadota bacterium]